MFFQDILRNPHCRIDSKERVTLAMRISDFEKAAKPSGKGTSGVAIRDHYERFRDQVTEGVGITLDPKRLFDESQKDELYRRAGGVCAVCVKPVETFEAEADHFPIAWRDGGPTSLDNGRLVHASCHSRGRPSIDASVDGE